MHRQTSSLALFTAFAVILACSVSYASQISAIGGMTVNSVIDVGQSAVATATVSGASGAPYSGEWTWIGPGLGANQTAGAQPGNVIPISQARSVFFSPNGLLAYVITNFNITVVSTSTNKTISAIPLTGYLTGGAVNSQGTLAYLTCCLYSSTNAVYVVSLHSGSLTGSIPFATRPTGVAFNPSGTAAYVSNGVDALTEISTAANTVQGAIQVPSLPTAFAFNPQGTQLYVGAAGSKIYVFDAATGALSSTIVSNTPSYIFFNPSGTLAYAINYTNAEVSVISTASGSVVNTISAGSFQYNPSAGGFSPSGTLAYIGSYSSSFATAVDVPANATMPPVTANGNNYAAAFDPLGRPAYIASYTSGSVLAIAPPESLVQALPGTSNGLLQLGIYAESSNKLLFTFNGATYTQSSGNATVYGNWTIYGFAQSAGGQAYGGNSILLYGSLRVNPKLTISSLSAVNATALEGHGETLNGSWAGGTPPYSVSFGVYNSANGNVLAYGAFSALGATTKSFTFNVPYGSNSLGSPEVKLTVTDSASDPQSTLLASSPIVSVKAYNAQMGLSLCNAYGFEGRYYLSNSKSCSITAQVQSASSQLSGSLYIDNALVANTVQYGTNSLSYALNLRPGTYYVSFNTPGNSAYVQEGISATLVVVNASTGMGINAGPYWWGFTTSEYNALGAHNVTYLRMDLLKPPDTAYQSEISNLTAHGFRIIGILDYNTVCGAHGNDTCPPWGLSAWNAAVANALAAYPTVHVWEIWNEPQYSYSQSGYLTNGTPANYSRMVESASALIRAHNASDTVLCFGGDNLYSGGDAYDAQFYQWAQQVWSNLTAATATSDCSAISLHAYTSYYGWLLNQTPPGGSYTMAQVLGQGLSAYESLTGKPIWITEYGMPADNSCRSVPCNLSSQAAFDAQGAALFLSEPYIRNIDVYNIEDSGYGLFNYSQGVNDTANALPAARPSFYSYTNFSNAVNGAGPAAYLSIVGSNTTVQPTTTAPATSMPSTTSQPTTSRLTTSQPTTSQPITTAGSSGGGAGGGASGGGNFKPTTQLSGNSTSSYYYVYNFTQDNTVHMTLNGTAFNVTDNYNNPASAGITVNGHAYPISMNQTVGLGTYGNYSYSIRLYNVSYLPILHTIRLRLSSRPIGAGIYTYDVSGPAGSISIAAVAGINDIVDYSGSAAVISLKPQRNSAVTVSIANVSRGSYPAAPKNYTLLSALNVSVSGASASAGVTMEYACAVPSGLIRPFILLNGAWHNVGNFIVDSQKCDATFSMPADPIVAVMEHSPSSAPSSLTTSAPSAPTTSAPAPGQQLPLPYTYLAAAIVIVAALACWLLLGRRDRGKTIY